MPPIDRQSASMTGQKQVRQGAPEQSDDGQLRFCEADEALPWRLPPPFALQHGKLLA